MRPLAMADVRKVGPFSSAPEVLLFVPASNQRQQCSHTAAFPVIPLCCSDMHPLLCAIETPLQENGERSIQLYGEPLIPESEEEAQERLQLTQGTPLQGRRGCELQSIACACLH